jgi:hypothetical protein
MFSSPLWAEPNPDRHGGLIVSRSRGAKRRILVMVVVICERAATGLAYGRPEPSIEAVAGAPAIKSATLTLTVDYEAGAPLS